MNFGQERNNYVRSFSKVSESEININTHEDQNKTDGHLLPELGVSVLKESPAGAQDV